MNPCISIIIPCYNASSYIERCLTSICSQTIGVEKLEIILVNDASTDNTLELLEQWEKRYPEQIIVVTYDTNVKQGGARNAGLCYANGDYIGFVDADDWIEPEMYEEFYRRAREGSFDSVCGKFIHESSYNNTIPKQRDSSDIIYDFESRDGFYWNTVEESGVNGSYERYIWLGIFKRSVILNNQLRFPEGVIFEDSYWLSVWQLYCKNLCIVDRVFYHYYHHPESSMMKRNNPAFFDRLSNEVKLIQEYKSRGALKARYAYIMFDFLERYYLNSWHVFFTHFDDIPEVYYEMRKTIYRIIPGWEDLFPIDTFAPIHQLLLRFLRDRSHATKKELQALKNEYLELL